MIENAFYKGVKFNTLIKTKQQANKPTTTKKDLKKKKKIMEVLLEQHKATLPTQK